jgi:hypothetical protein
MKDKSVAMPCESSGAALAWLTKHVIDTQAIKGRRCIIFPRVEVRCKAPIFLSHHNATGL